MRLPLPLRLLTRTIAAYRDDKGPLLGAGLAFYGLSSAAPMVLLIVALLSLAIGEDAARGEVSGALIDLMGERVARALLQMVSAAYRSQGEAVASIVGIGLVLYATSRWFSQVENSLNQVFGVRQNNRHVGDAVFQLVAKRSIGLLLFVLLAVLLLASLAFSSALTAAGRGWDVDLPVSLLRAVDMAVVTGSLTVGFACLFKWLPGAKLRWRAVWPGALFTAALFMVGKMAVGAYLGRIGESGTFGAFGAIVVLVLWMAYTSQMFLFGAEFTKVWAAMHGGGVMPQRGWKRVETAPVDRVRYERDMLFSLLACGGGPAPLTVPEDTLVPPWSELAPIGGSVLLCDERRAVLDGVPQDAAETWRDSLVERGYELTSDGSAEGRAQLLLTSETDGLMTVTSFPVDGGWRLVAVRVEP